MVETYQKQWHIYTAWTGLVGHTAEKLKIKKVDTICNW